MLNSHTTWRVRQRLDGWLAETGLPADAPASYLDRVPAADVDQLASRLFSWLVNRRRKLPTGMTLAELAGGDLDDYENHADQALGSFAAQANSGAPGPGSRVPPPLEDWPARTGGDIHAGLPWSAGSFRPSP